MTFKLGCAGKPTYCVHNGRESLGRRSCLHARRRLVRSRREDRWPGARTQYQIFRDIFIKGMKIRLRSVPAYAGALMMMPSNRGDANARLKSTGCTHAGSETGELHVAVEAESFGRHAGRCHIVGTLYP